MKWLTLVACLIVCFSKLKGSNAIPVVSGPLTSTGDHLYANDPVNVNPYPSIATLMTTLCTSTTLDTLPPSALVSIVNTLLETPKLFNTLPPCTIVSLLSAILASPSALNELSPIALLVLLAAVSSAAPSFISSIPPPVLFPLLKTLSSSGLLPPPGSPPATVYAQLPPLPPPSRQIVYPGPTQGPMYIDLPKKSYKPPPIVVPSGPPQSIVVSFPRPYPYPPPLIMPQAAPGPIVVNENQNAEPPSLPIVIPAPTPPNIYFTTHPSIMNTQNYYNSIGDKAVGLRNWLQSPLEMPKVYTLPPGVAPTEYASRLLKNVPKSF